MNRDDLLKMLKRAPAAPAAAAEGEPDAVVPEARPDDAPASPTALAVDAWGLRRGRELAEAADNERLAKALFGEYEDAPEMAMKDSAQDRAAHVAADCFAAAFEPEPRLAPRCQDPARGEFFKQLLETPDYQALHSQTQLDPVASELAATAFAEQVAVVCRECERPEADPEAEALKGVARALGDAAKDVTDYQDACAALGCGSGPGSNGTIDARKAAAAFKRVRSSQQLRRIAQLAGRFRRVAQAQQRRKALHAQDEVAGVELGADLARLLPAELVKLVDEDLGLDALRRLAERQTMQRELTATEPVGKGPVVVCVDESGSMTGEPVAAAKALALAVAWVARQQRRWCCLIAYSGATGERVLVLPVGKWDDAALLDWLEAFIDGGSSLDVPLVELPDKYWPAIGAPPGKTDLLLVTDAIVKCPAKVRDNFLAWKKAAKVRCVSIVINEPPGDLAAVSDETYRVSSSIAADSEAAAAAVSF